MERLERALAGVTSEAMEYPFLAPQSAKSGWISGTSAPLRNARGEIVGVIGTVQETTLRQRAEAQVERLTDLLKVSQSIARVGGWEIDLASRSPYWTDETYAIHDTSPEAYIPTLESALSFYAPEALPVIQDAVRKAIEEGCDFDLELELLTAKQRRVWIQSSGRAVREAGRVIKVVGAFRDVTERKRAEAALRESEQEYRRLVQDMQVGVLLQGPQADIRLSNPMALELLGLSEDQLLGKTSYDPEWNVIHEDGSPYPGPTHPVPQAIATRKPVRGAVLGVHRPVMGDRVWLSVDAVPQLNEAGEVRQVVCSFIDISQRKQAEEEQHKLEARMSQVQKLEALGVLVAGVAHNLNNVLAAIMATSSLHETLTAEAKDLEAYRIIGMACKRGRDVVRSLMQFARPTLASQVPVEMHALVREVRTLLENTTGSRIQIVEAFCEKPLWLQGDPGSISNALMNLCLNALDAMPNGGTLTFRTTCLEEGWLELAVADSGEGMTPDVLTRVLEPFYTTKPVGKGTGLGLSMTHGVVKAHGGTLEITSALQEGTTVRLKFPQIPAPPGTQAAEASARPRNPLRILLVDDDEDVCFLVARMLRSAGLQVKTVPGGEEALESLRSGALPDLVILDQNMPRMDGIQTMRKIRELHLTMPILISSGQPDIQEWACFKQPKVAVIPKPFELDEILAQLARISLEFGNPQDS
jgi:PAS domain S-box-containing protein